MSVEQVAITGFNVPPPPEGANFRNNAAPANVEQKPGFVAPTPAPADAPPADVQALIDAAVAKALAAAAPAKPAPAATPPGAAPKVTADAAVPNDALLAGHTRVLTGHSAGLDLDRALGQALAQGDSTRIDRAYILEKGGADGAYLVSVAEAMVERVNTQTAAAMQAVHAAAGGQAEWSTAVAAFNQSAPAHLRQVVSQMLESGDNATISAASKTVVDYVKQGGLVVTKAGLLNPDSSVSAAEGMSDAQFKAAHFKLNVNSPTYMAERTALFARRSVGKQLGM